MHNLDFHSFFSTKSMVIITVLVVVVSVVVSFFIEPNKYKDTRFHVGVAVFLIVLSLGSSSLTLEEQKDMNRVTSLTKAVADLWAKPNEFYSEQSILTGRICKKFIL